jgi:hypothetical protein
LIPAAAVGAHDHASLGLARRFMREKERQRHAKEPRHRRKVGDRRRGDAALHLAGPADRAAELQRHLLKRQPPRLAQRAQILRQKLARAEQFG